MSFQMKTINSSMTLARRSFWLNVNGAIHITSPITSTPKTIKLAYWGMNFKANQNMTQQNKMKRAIKKKKGDYDLIGNEPSFRMIYYSIMSWLHKQQFERWKRCNNQSTSTVCSCDAPHWRKKSLFLFCCVYSFS